MDSDADIRRIVEYALAEDVGPGDVTSTAIIPPSTHLRGVFLVKAPGVIAGLGVVGRVFAAVDEAIRYEPLVEEGTPVAPGDVVAQVEGDGPGVLIAERVALNFLQRMSGIATRTRQYVEAVRGTRPRPWTPARRCRASARWTRWPSRWGAANHRIGLFDMVLIKDNHIEAAGGITPAVRMVRERVEGLAIEVEVESLEQFDEALGLGVDRIMLDNMDLDTMREAVRRRGKAPVEIEASGGITLDTVAGVAATGVDLISVGDLTHSVRALDVSLDITLSMGGKR